MNTVLGPFKAHQLKHFPELPEVKVLLGRDNINIFIKIVMLFSVHGGRNVARAVQSRSVGLCDQGRRKIELIEHDDIGAL